MSQNALHCYWAFWLLPSDELTPNGDSMFVSSSDHLHARYRKQLTGFHSSHNINHVLYRALSNPSYSSKSYQTAIESIIINEWHIPFNF